MKNSYSDSSKKDIYFSPNHINPKLKQQAMKGAGATIFSQVLNYGIQMIGTIILARMLTPDDFGLITMVTAFSLLLQNFGVNGFTEAVIQWESINHKQISTLFWVNSIINLFLALIFMASATIIAAFYNEPRLELITVVIAFSIVFSGLSTEHVALLKRNMLFYKTSANEIVAVIFSVILAIFLAWDGWGYWALAAKRIALPFSIAVGAWILCRWRPGLPARNTGIWPMLKFAFNTYGNFLLYYFSKNLDKILLGRYYGSQSLGNYQKAYDLFVMPANQLTHPLTSVAVATLSKLRNDPQQFRNYYVKAVSVIAFIGMPLSAVLTLIGYDLILLLLGPQWHEAGHIFTAFAPCIGLMLIYFTHGWLHLSLGKADRWLIWSIIALIVTAILFVIGLFFGPLGVAIAYAGSFYVLIGPGLWFAGRPIQLKVSSVFAVIWKDYLLAIFTFGISWFILYSLEITSTLFLNFSVFIRIFAASFIAIAIHLLLVIVSRGGTSPIIEFLSILREMLPNVFKRKK